MEDIHWEFAKRFGSQWVKVKFFKERPDSTQVKRVKRVRFCEAVKKAIVGPILLDRESIICEGAQYAFGWKENAEEQFLNKCQIKSKNQMIILKSLFLKTTHLTESFEYIGLNVEGEPDLIISFMLPEQVMNLIKVYNAYQGNNLDVSLSSMMSICGGIAVRTLIEDTICFSFGCDESRQFARLGNDRVAVGVPKRLFTIFAGEVLV